MIEENRLKRVDVLVMAAGTGSRMGMAERKQWLSLCGLPLFVYTLRRLREYDADSLIAVIHPDDELRVVEALAMANLADVRVVVGGDTRQESVRRGLTETSREYVAVHDGARPFLTRTDFLRVLEAAIACGAATIGWRVRDTLKRVDEGGKIVTNVDRDRLWAVATPQVFLREWLLYAHEVAAADGFTGTDDTVLLERVGRAVAVVEGAPWNVKVTERADLQWIRLWEMAMCE